MISATKDKSAKIIKTSADARADIAQAIKAGSEKFKLLVKRRRLSPSDMQVLKECGRSSL